jgi:carboxymethylenebutenolidase
MGSTINLKSADGFTLSAYTAGPAGATKGIVVIQEIFGVNHHMRDMCDRFAAEGYAVVSPALFDRAERGVELVSYRLTLDAFCKKSVAIEMLEWHPAHAVMA